MDTHTESTSDAEHGKEKGCPFMRNKKLLAILLVGVALRLFLVFTAAGINNDGFKYVSTARQIANGGIMAGMEGDYFWPYFPVNRQLVFYPFLGSVVNCVVGDMVLSLRLVSALAGIGLIWLGYAISKELFDRETVALLAAGLLAIHPEFTEASAAVYREVLMAFLLMLSFLLFLWTIRGREHWPRWAVVTGLTLFAAFMTRPDAAAAAAAMGLIALFVAPALKWKKRLAICTLMGLAFMALEVPSILWMKQKTGYWMVTQWQIEDKIPRPEAARRYLRGNEEGFHERD